MSRLVTLLLLASVEPDPLTAEQAMGTYRKVFRPTRELNCPTTAQEEIVVCAPSREQDPYRLQNMDLSTPGQRVRGEASSATALLNKDKCTHVGPFEDCGGSIPIGAIVIGIAKAVAKKVAEQD